MFVFGFIDLGLGLIVSFLFMTAVTLSYWLKILNNLTLCLLFFTQTAECVTVFKLVHRQSLHSSLSGRRVLVQGTERREKWGGEQREAQWCMPISLKYPCSSCTISAATPVAMALSCRHASVSESASLRRCTFSATSENAPTEQTLTSQANALGCVKCHACSSTSLLCSGANT